MEGGCRHVEVSGIVIKIALLSDWQNLPRSERDVYKVNDATSW